MALQCFLSTSRDDTIITSSGRLFYKVGGMTEEAWTVLDVRQATFNWEGRSSHLYMWILGQGNNQNLELNL